MAITYEKGKGITKRTGFDKAAHRFGSALEKIKSTTKRVVTRPARAAAAKRKGDAQKELKGIERAFGSTRRYEELYPETRKRNEELRKTAGF